MLAVAEGEGVMYGEVVVVEELGSEAFVHIRLDHGDNEVHELVVRALGETSFDADGEHLGD